MEKKTSIGFGPVEERVTNPQYFDSKMQKNIIARETFFFYFAFEPSFFKKAL